jgi:hypothetical protein
MGRRGPELKDIDSQLALDLEQGTLLLRVIDGKGRDRQGTLAKLGELAVAKDGRLVAPPARDATLDALFPDTIGPWRTLVRDVPFPAEEFCPRCDSGKALRAALKAQGRTLADVSMLSATAVDPENVIENAFNEPAIQAIRAAEGDASQLVEPVITYLRERASAELVRVDGDGIVAVSRPPDEYNFGWTAFVYPEGDTVWVVRSYGATPTELLASLPGAPVPPSVTAPRPTPATDTSTPEGWARTTLPSEFRGEPVRAEVIAVFDDGSSAMKQLKRELRKQDKSIADTSQILAFTPSGYEIQGFRVVEGDASALLEYVLASGRQAGAFGDQDPVESVISGKSVMTLEGPMGTLHVYPSGEVLWMIPGSETLAGEWIAALP